MLQKNNYKTIRSRMTHTTAISWPFNQTLLKSELIDALDRNLPDSARICDLKVAEELESLSDASSPVLRTVLTVTYTADDDPFGSGY